MSWSDTDFQHMSDKLDELVVAVTKLAANDRRIDLLEETLRATLEELKKVDRARGEDRRELDKWKYLVTGGFLALSGFIAFAVQTYKVLH